MKLVIENYDKDMNLFILNLSSVFSKNIVFKNLQYENNTATTVINYNKSIIKISPRSKDQNNKKFIFKFLNNNNLIHKSEGKECFIKINDGKIESFDSREFNKLRGPLVTQHNKSIITQWNTYWYYLHWLCYNYPKNPTKDDKQQIIDLVTKMRTTGIKCEKCRSHFDAWLKKKDIKPFLDSQEKLFDYFFTLHNDVNERNKKKIFTLDEAIALFRDKDWDTHLKQYKVDIISLFKEKKLGTFPDLFYSTVNVNLRNIIGITQTIEKLKRMEEEPFFFDQQTKVDEKNIIREGIITKREGKVQVTVSQGWNLIGSVKNGRMREMNIENKLIYEFSNGSYKLVDKMEIGKGYWVKCISDGVLEYE